MYTCAKILDLWYKSDILGTSLHPVRECSKISTLFFSVRVSSSSVRLALYYQFDAANS
jgi:hypothetical protein